MFVYCGINFSNTIDCFLNWKFNKIKLSRYWIIKFNIFKKHNSIHPTSNSPLMLRARFHVILHVIFFHAFHFDDWDAIRINLNSICSSAKPAKVSFLYLFLTVSKLKKKFYTFKIYSKNKKQKTMLNKKTFSHIWRLMINIYELWQLEI